MNTITYDVAVLGAGPGGSAAALEAARTGMSVVLFEPQRRGTEKPCGEGLMPAGREALAHLGLTRAIRCGRPFKGLRYYAGGSDPFDIDLPSAGLGLRRKDLVTELDLALGCEDVTRVRAAGRVKRGARGFEIESMDGSVLARTLVVADGFSGGGAAWLRGDRRRAPRRLGVRAHFLGGHQDDRVAVHLGRGAEIYVTPLPGGIVNVAALGSIDSDRSTAAEWLERAFEAHPLVRRCLGEQLDPAQGRGLGYDRPQRVVGGGAFLVGDAGGGVDPILGCGLTVALRTGVAAGRAAAQSVRGEPDELVSRAYRRFYRAETRARRMLAAGLLFVAQRDRLARVVARIARVTPLMSRRVARVAANGRERSLESMC